MIHFSDEQSRALVNLRQAYDHWIAGLRSRRKQPYGMRFVKRGDHEYLYEFRDRSNNGRSLGPRNPETEARLKEFQNARAEVDGIIAGTWERVSQSGRICRALQVPALASEAGKILVALDEREMLGTYIMVAGTNAILAYIIEAGGPIIIGADMATDDFDLLWSRDHNTSLLLQGGATDEPPSIVGALKSVDETYTVNEERPFQLRNRTAYEVEVLVPPSRLQTLPKADRIRTAPHMRELEWLLKGITVEQVVPAKREGVGKIVAPDPRFFALQKLFISEKHNRNRLKKTKDKRQADAILKACRNGDLPRHPLDDNFIYSIPDELRSYWNQWAAA